MKKNMGTIDKVIRIMVAVVIAVLYFTHIIAGVFILTSLVSFCPLYTALGIKTTKQE